MIIDMEITDDYGRGGGSNGRGKVHATRIEAVLKENPKISTIGQKLEELSSRTKIRFEGYNSLLVPR